MEVVIRQYSGDKAKALFDVLEKNKAEIEEVIQGVGGVISYTLARTDNGGLAVTVGKDRAAIENSNQTAKAWIAKNASDIGADAPGLTTATVIMHMAP